ncbi:helix-turn-helix transcriptional regulator [Bergeriella denitrificans]|uniref:Putative prophage regulator protein n=1 Tax=Bergeriella denitrificans TaxID=494 RepID=A0A378UHT1_BERDE|nr:AlpA family phage regulatory protein [Bergeriella denitrificans]STZ76855.1 putative prophage regulator protein [Bergeriella denitrificans]
MTTNTNTTTPTTDQFIRVKELAATFGVSATSIWGWCNPKDRRHKPDFPKPIKLSANTTVWSLNAVNAYIGKLAEQAAN